MEDDGSKCYIVIMDEQAHLSKETDRLGAVVEDLGPDGTAAIAVALTWAVTSGWLGFLDLLGHTAAREYILGLLVYGSWVQWAAVSLIVLSVSIFAASAGYLFYRKMIARRVQDQLFSHEWSEASRERMSPNTHRFYPTNTPTE